MMNLYTKAAIWDTLVNWLGASSKAIDFYQFSQRFPECREYRFMGEAGFGGKVWRSNDGRVYVTCYTEDETPRLKELIEAANASLARLLASADTHVEEGS